LSETHRHRRRSFVSKPNFQLKLTIVIMLVVTIVANLVGAICYLFISEKVSQIIAANQADFAGIGMNEVAQFLVPRILLAEAISLCIVFILAILITHTIAGPVYRLERTAEEIGEGNLGIVTRLRPRDEFKELADAVNEMCLSLAARVRRVRKAVEDAEAAGDGDFSAIYQRLDEEFTLPPEDAALLSAATGGQARVSASPFGVDVAAWAPPEESPDRAREGRATLVFLANFAHPPNVRAAEWLLERVFPPLRGRHPGLAVRIVGAEVPPNVRRFEGEEGVHIVGPVADPRPELWSATVFVAPLFTGRGMRIKTLEALAAGVPAVGTPLAFHGVGGAPGEDYLVGEDEAAFTRAIDRLLGDRELARRLGRRGRRHVASHLDLRALGEGRDAIWREVVRLGDGTTPQE